MNGNFTDLLILLIATNGVPIVAARIFRSHLALPLDCGLQLSDGRSLFGPSKTWRGLIAALVASCVISVLLGFGAGFGLVFGALVMIGDLCSSFIKRRRGLESSARCLGLDQIPEALLASLYAVWLLGYPWWWAGLLAVVFMLLDILLSRPLFWLHIRNRPY